MGKFCKGERKYMFIDFNMTETEEVVRTFSAR